MIRLGVTGTDTNVGKTVVARALVTALRDRGLSVAAMKPVETGVEGDPLDGRQLWEAAGGTDAMSDVCPEQFAAPLAPWVAARLAGRAIDLPAMEAARARLEAGRDALVVEGAGGLLVPIADGVAYDTLFRRWRMELIVVAGNRLGAVNHTLLTVRAAQHAGLTLRAIIVNTLSPDTPTTAEHTNLDTIRRLVPSAMVLPFPYVTPGSDHRAGAWALGALIDAIVPSLVQR